MTFVTFQSRLYDCFSNVSVTQGTKLIRQTSQKLMECTSTNSIRLFYFGDVNASNSFALLSPGPAFLCGDDILL